MAAMPNQTRCIIQPPTELPLRVLNMPRRKAESSLLHGRSACTDLIRSR